MYRSTITLMRSTTWRTLLIILLLLPSYNAFSTFSSHSQRKVSFHLTSLDQSLYANSNDEDPSTGYRTVPLQKTVKRTVNSPDQNRIINNGITTQETALDLLTFLSTQKGALTSKAGGGKLNSVNFSTALHRIARHVSNNSNNNNHPGTYNNYNNNSPNEESERNDRAKVLTDPRFALLLCSTAEAMMDETFGAREMSNIAWAIAKLKVTPPQRVMPLDVAPTVQSKLKTKSEQVRSLVYQVAKERKNGDSSTTSWIPALSELSAVVLDAISYRAVGVNPNMFRLQEWANLLWSLATTGRADPQVCHFIIDSLMKGKLIGETNNEVLRPQEWSNSIWALATTGILGPEEKFIPFVADLMESDPGFLNIFKPQELSNTIWGIATILSKRPGQPTGTLNDAALKICRYVAQQVVERKGERFKSQEMTNTVWALATLGVGIPTDLELAERSDYKFLSSDDLEGDGKLIKKTIKIVFEDAKGSIRRYRPQELNNLCWVMARMDLKDDKLMEMIATELSNPRRKVSSQDLGATLWSMATSEFDQAFLYRALAARWTPEMAKSAKPQELSNSVWALATADITAKYPDIFDTTILAADQRRTPSNPQEDPVIKCFTLASQELMRRPHQFKAQEIKDILWSCSRNGIRHPTLFRAMAEYLMGSDEYEGRGLNEFSVQAVGNTAWSYARQAQLGAETIQRYKGKTLLPRTSGRLAHYMVLITDVGEALIQALYSHVAEVDLVMFDKLTRMKPQDVSNTAWAFAIVGIQHTEFLNSVAFELERRLRFFTPQETVNALWALATLDHCPPNLLYKLESGIVSLKRSSKDSRFWTTSSISKVWKRQELANLAWVCAVFGEYPMDLIKMIYMGLLGVGDDPTPDAVTECHATAGLGLDEGISATIVMSVTYLQMMMDLDPSIPQKNRIHLPNDFPDDWLRRGASGGSSLPSRFLGSTTAETEDLLEVYRSDQENSGDLQLFRSNLQQTVSGALHRIGFHHVEEYVFDMATLAKDYRLLSAGLDGNENKMSTEILSLDMANVPDRIGIEVDGPGHFIINIDNLNDLDDDNHRPAEVYTSANGRREVLFGWNSDSTRIIVKKNGPTALKSRLLKAMGWTIHNIPFWDWAKVDGNLEAEEEYCRSRLLE